MTTSDHSRPATGTAPPRRVHYVHTLDYSWQERLVGAFVIGAFLLLIAGLVFNDRIGFLLTDSFELHVLTDRAEGLSTRTRVYASGVEVGRVRAIAVDEAGRIDVALQIRAAYGDLIREDSVATVGAPSMLGSATVDISGGSEGAPPILPGARLRVQPGASLNDAISEIGPAVQNLADILNQLNAPNADGTPQLQQMVEDVAGVTANLHQLSDTLVTGDGSLPRLIREPDALASLEQTLDNAQALTRNLQEQMQAIEPMMQDVATMTAQLPQLSERLMALEAHASELMATLADQGEAVPGMVRDMQALLDEVSKTVEAVNTTWPISRGVERQEAAERPTRTVLPPQ
ncbi:MlaD family protein [Abyssibacter profundi]|uniref:Mce/MlaD domain-containing protein n=1 Tax=Abyssibacter profundi TaxID=2182787 RepID=A0A383XQI6_9GAMM|nr:MlaD family protein [Abyssibacter profundi]PWN54890.1 hypothetical protein DEH80_14950 [Abyssibacter profundi]